MKHLTEMALRSQSSAGSHLFKGPEHRVHLRMAQDVDAIWLDLADVDSRAVRIDKEGWRVVLAAEVAPKFHRPPNMRPLPEPAREGADASHLLTLVRLADENTFRLLLTWLSFALVPNKPYPILAVSGPTEVAKSSFAEFVRATIDPSEVPLFGTPRREDLPAFAKNNPVLCFDNPSTIGAHLADDLCRLATGGGLGGRKFYANDGEATFNVRRPVLLTAMNYVATRGDLADRTIVVRLEKIREAARQTDAEVRKGFAKAHPQILAALLDMVAMGLRRSQDVRKERRRLPPMADFALWGFAVAPAIGWSAEDFDRAYRSNRRETFEAAIEDDPIAPHILSLLERQKERSWQGTTEQLWMRIKEIAGEAAHALNFPQSSVALGRALRPIEPALASRGVIMQRDWVEVGSLVSLRVTA